MCYLVLLLYRSAYYIHVFSVQVNDVLDWNQSFTFFISVTAKKHCDLEHIYRIWSDPD